MSFLVIQPNYEALTTPKLDVMPVDELFCPYRGICIVRAGEGPAANEMSVITNRVSPILNHQAWSSGRSSPVRSLATSGDFVGSSPEQSRQWKLRPLALRSRNCMS
jgi:hypothetical protein